MPDAARVQDLSRFSDDIETRHADRFINDVDAHEAAVYPSSCAELVLLERQRAGAIAKSL